MIVLRIEPFVAFALKTNSSKKFTLGKAKPIRNGLDNQIYIVYDSNMNEVLNKTSTKPLRITL